ncbi:MAG: DUF1849 family protein [Proteobacteria bacterium]|nr:DUF1849 family protein [Pseudomonadota bacterium]
MKIRLKIAAASVAGLLISGPALTAEIVPHQALYRLTLQDMKIDGWAESSNGTMEVKVHRDCFHYGIDRHIDFKIRYTDDRETHIVIEERLREAVKAQQYWFWSRTTLNGKTVAIIAGDAVRPEGGTLIEVQDETVADAAKAAGSTEKAIDPAAAQAEAEAKKALEQQAAQQDNGTIEMRLLGVQVIYNWPDDRKTEVDAASIFPFDALKRQLDSLEAGSLQPEFVVFDGLNKDDSYRAVYRPAQIAQVANPIVPDGDAELLDAPAWRFTTQYFLMGSESRTPARTITSKVHANGVVSDTIIDLGPFSFKGTLAWLKGEPIPDC